MWIVLTFREVSHPADPVRDGRDTPQTIVSGRSSKTQLLRF